MSKFGAKFCGVGLGHQRMKLESLASDLHMGPLSSGADTPGGMSTAIIFQPAEVDVDADKTGGASPWLSKHTIVAYCAGGIRAVDDFGKARHSEGS